MQLTLHISNGDEKLLKVLKNVISMHPQAKVQVKKVDIKKLKNTPKSEKSIDIKHAKSLQEIEALPTTKKEMQELKAQVMQECGL